MVTMKKLKNTKVKIGKNKNNTVKGVGAENNQKYFVAINQDLKKIQEVLKNEMATKKYLEVLRSEMATKTDLQALRSETKTEFQTLRSEIATKKELNELRKDMNTMKEELNHEFCVAVEDIKSTVKGAVGDMHSLVIDVKEDHEIRIVALEVRAGLRVE